MAPSPVIGSRLEKAAVDNGFDQELPREGGWLGFASTQCPLRVWLGTFGDAIFLAAFSQQNVTRALGQDAKPMAAPLPSGAVGGRTVADIPALHRLLRRAFQLSRTLPNELLNTFEKQTAALPRSTEAERLAVQRVGQNLFRQGLIEYWEGRCAVTDLAVAALLRASHIKPWADCAADAERLDIFNGILLAPHLDAAFDGGFITIADDGAVEVSGALDGGARQLLGLDRPMRVRALADGHRKYLPWHRARVFRQPYGLMTSVESEIVTREGVPMNTSVSGSPSAGAPSPIQAVYDRWKLRGDGPVVVVDETKTDLFGSPHGQLFIYSGVVLTESVAATTLERIYEQRQLLNPEDRDRRLKTPDMFSGRTPVPYYELLCNEVAATCGRARRIHCLATTSKHLDDCEERVRITMTGDDPGFTPFTGREAIGLLLWLKQIAVDEKLVHGTWVDVVIDSSEGLGLKPGNIMTWEKPDEHSDGSATKVVCGCKFRLIADSDDGPLKDLLMVPDMLGNIALKKSVGGAPGYAEARKAVIEDGVPFRPWSYSLNF